MYLQLSFLAQKKRIHKFYVFGHMVGTELISVKILYPALFLPSLLHFKTFFNILARVVCVSTAVALNCTNTITERIHEQIVDGFPLM